MTAGQLSVSIGAAALLDDPRKAKWLMGARGHDAGWFSEPLQAKDITPCIPGRKSRRQSVKHDKGRYKLPQPPRDHRIAGDGMFLFLPGETAREPPRLKPLCCTSRYNPRESAGFWSFSPGCAF